MEQKPEPAMLKNGVWETGLNRDKRIQSPDRMADIHRHSALLMKKGILLFLFFIAVLCSASPEHAASDALRKVRSGSITYHDPSGFFYHAAELEHLAAGPLAEGKIRNVSKCTRKQAADPVPAIAAFSDDLKKRGIRLIVIPVPPKAAVHPFSGLKPGEAMQHLHPLYEELRKKGVCVLDLSGPFLTAAKQNRKVFCVTDSHWAPEGIILAAELAAKETGPLPGPVRIIRTREEKITFTGDLCQGAVPAPREEVSLRIAEGEIFSGSSPVLVMGDSHTLVFSEKEDGMIADRSGFCEQLAVNLRRPVDSIRTLGSASTSVRVTLFRKVSADPEWLKGKKVIFWCFAARELTESATGWVRVPVSR